jgi:uncharacterized lipoprotein YddW (UPF0748 family)
VQDVVKRYDVDGIVFDDYFYPYPEKTRAGQDVDFPDDASWKKYGAASRLNRDDWRRDNVNRFVRQAGQTVHAAKPWVQFGISPFGIWRPQTPAQIRGMDAYAKIYADARKWLADGSVDYFVPQLYWGIAPREQSFPVLFDWWRAQNSKGRHLWPALADYSVGGKFSTEEIPRQLQITRQKSDPGAVHYHLRSVLDNPALAAAVRVPYAQPALVPVTPWLASVPPKQPGITVDAGKNSAHVRWKNSGVEPPAGWVLQSRTNGIWTTQIFPPGRSDCYLDHVSPDAIAIRAVGRLGVLSEPAVWSPKKYSTAENSRGAVRLK